METIEYIKTLGNGTFGDVYLCKMNDGQMMAVKRFFIPKGNKNVGIINLKELNVMKVAQGHPNLMSMKYLWTTKPFSCNLKDIKSNGDRKSTKTDGIYIGMQPADMCLLDLIDDKENYLKIPGSQRIQWCLQILNGLSFLHDNNIVHRDLKTNNILCFKNEDGTFTIKLTDYGCSRPVRIGENNTREFGNINYNAPEHLFVRNKYDKGVDIWALAICFIEILTGIFIFDFVPKPPKVGKKITRPSSHKELTFKRMKNIFKIVGVPSEPIYNRLMGPDLPNFPYSKVSEIKPIGIQSFFDIKNPLVSDLGNQETIDMLISMIKGMMEIDTDERMTCNQVMQHKVFHPYLETINRIPVKINPPGNPHWMEGKGLSVFRNLLASINEDLDYCKSTKMIFLGLDIYHRVSQHMHSNPTTKHSKCFKTIGSINVAACCIYIAFKYYTDSDSLSFETIFSDINIVDTNFRHINKVEKHILLAIGHRITRPCIFDYIKRRGILGKLFHFLIEESDWYDIPPDETAAILNRE